MQGLQISENEFVFFFEILFLRRKITWRCGERIMILVVFKIQRIISIEPWLSNTEFCPPLLIFEVTHM